MRPATKSNATKRRRKARGVSAPPKRHAPPARKPRKAAGFRGHVPTKLQSRTAPACALCGAPFRPGERRPLVSFYDSLRMRPVQRHVCATCYADAARDYGYADAATGDRVGALRPAIF